MYGMGVAIADYDNDGRDDVYITALDGDHLFHNEGNGKFRDVTKSLRHSKRELRHQRRVAGLRPRRQAGPVRRELCAVEPEAAICGARWMAPPSRTARRNPTKARVAGCFTISAADVSKTSPRRPGVGDPTSKSLGVAVLDYNGDGWPDLFVANDTQPNKLYRNNRNGTFTEEGMAAGVAYGEDGVARGAMGVDSADYDRSGRAHLLVGNFSNQMLGLYHNEGNGLFVDEAPSSTVGRSSLLTLTFGVFFFDYDLDGYPDIFAANGHIEEQIGRVQPKVSYRQAPLLFRNLGRSAIRERDSRDGRGVQSPHRGARRGLRRFRPRWRPGPSDLHQQRPGISVSQRRRQSQSLAHHPAGRHQEQSGWHWQRGSCHERSSGKQWSMVHSGSSYCSQSDLAATFGLGKDTIGIHRNRMAQRDQADHRHCGC